MNDFTKNLVSQTSIPLAGGGDTHFHPWENGRGFTATTRLQGGFEHHENFRFHEMFGQRTPPQPNVLGKMPW